MTCISMNTFAQSERGKWSIHPRVGMNIAMMTNSDGADPRIGFAGGAEAEYQINDVVSISGGVMYSMQGLKESEDGTDMTLKLDYINVPIMVNFYVVKGLALKIGIQPGFNISDDVKVSSGGVNVTMDYDKVMSMSGVDGEVKSVDFSIPYGLSYEYKNLVVDARYNWGITKAVTAAGESARNSVFQITLGYKFHL